MHSRLVQIVSINEAGTSFELHDDQLREVLHRVPAEMPVAVMSVVGAFRTGKSFLLGFVLRYLRAFDEGAEGELSPLASPRQAAGSAEWMRFGGPSLLGSVNGNKMDDGGIAAAASCTSDAAAGAGDADAAATPAALAGKTASFAYRAGEDRMTTGIWMWSRPFFLSLPQARGERVAVLVVDTQGMFDRRTGIALTSAIFGLSTLLSSHQVYNLKNNVQEDHLQQLALFTEYGRTAEDSEEHSRDLAASASEPRAAAAATSTPSRAGGAVYGPGSRTAPQQPFQGITLLIRDSSVDVDVHDYDGATVDTSHKVLVEQILSEGADTDIINTRRAIRDCFEEIHAFRLPNPGKKVERPTFRGEMASIDVDFLCAVEKFVDDLFMRHLSTKRVRGIPLTAMDTLRYMRAYAKLFKDATIFPKPVSILEATADANNRNATSRSTRTYTTSMTRFMDDVGGSALSEEDFAARHAEACDLAMGTFESLATFGPRSGIAVARAAVEAVIEEEHARFKAANLARDPIRLYAAYIFPAIAAVVAVVSSFFLDVTCSPFFSVCSVGSQGFRFVSGICFVSLVIVFMMRGNSTTAVMKSVVGFIAGIQGVLSNNGSASAVAVSMLDTATKAARALSRTDTGTADSDDGTAGVAATLQFDADDADGTEPEPGMATRPRRTRRVE